MLSELLSCLVSSLLLLASFLALAVARSLLLLTTNLDRDAVVHGLLLVCHGSCALEDVRVALLELGQDLHTVLGLRKAAREHLDRLKHLGLKSRVGHNCNGLLENVVAKLMSDQALDNEVHADRASA